MINIRKMSILNNVTRGSEKWNISVPFLYSILYMNIQFEFLKFLFGEQIFFGDTYIDIETEIEIERDR